MKMRKAYRVLVGKPERRRLFGRPRSSWEDNIKMVLKYCGKFMHSVHCRHDGGPVAGFVITVVMFRVLYKAQNFLFG